MQRPLSKSTMPSGRMYSAETGQISTHGASAQWLQRMTWKLRRTAGNSPVSTCLTQVRFTPSGTSCSLLHASVQAWQPMHLRLSIRKPRRTLRLALRGAARASRLRRCARRGQEACEALQGLADVVDRVGVAEAQEAVAVLAEGRAGEAGHARLVQQARREVLAAEAGAADVREDVEGALRLDAAHALQRVEAGHDDVA